MAQLETYDELCYSVEEYLEMGREAFERSELIAGEIDAMAGEKGAHADISANLVGVFVNKLRGRKCRVPTNILICHY